MEVWERWRLKDMATPWLLLQLLLLLLSQASALSETLGVAPQDLKYYEDSTIWCKDRSTSFSRARLNDNFCDCADGTDEPGTSACPDGRFYCKNTGHSPQKIFSSRVNDGICGDEVRGSGSLSLPCCDGYYNTLREHWSPMFTCRTNCCDGTDEYEGRVKCTNTCWEAGKASREKLIKKLATYKEGLSIRRSEIENAKLSRQHQEAKLTSLRKEEKTQSELVRKLTVEKEAIEKRERQEEALKETQEKEEAEKKLREERAAAPAQKEGSIADNKDVEAANMGPDAVLEEVKSDVTTKEDTIRETGDINDDTGEAAEERPEVHLSDLEEEPDLEQLSKEEVGRVVAARWTGEDITVHAPKELTHHFSEDNDEDKENDNELEDDHDHGHEDNHDDVNGEGDDVDDSYGDYRHPEPVPSPKAAKPSWWRRFVLIPDVVMDLFIRQPVDKSEAERIRNQYSEATNKLSNLQNQISELEIKLKEDYGPEGEYYSFEDTCFELKIQKYVYKVCPFKQATQLEGHMTTRLGNWDGFKDNYGAMMFSHGDRCWNGPDRSLRVKLRCGLRTELRNVDEPSRCDYVAELVSPSRCLEAKVQELQTKLDQLQSGVHDEL